MRHALAAFCFAATISMPATVAAQTEAEADKFVEMVRTDLKKDKVAIIGASMGFTGDEAATFWPIYKEYETELSAIGDERIALIKQYAANFKSMTDATANELATKALGQEQKRLDLVKKFHARLSREMSPVLAARFIQIENRLNLILDLQMASEVPLIHKSGM